MGSALPSLVRWGLSPDADLVYRTLVSLDTAREGQLAHELGMAHERVREAMRELANAGAIRRVSAAPRRTPKATGRAVWAARQPNQVIRQLHVHRTRPVGTVAGMDPESAPAIDPTRAAAAPAAPAGPATDATGPDAQGDARRRWIPHQAACAPVENLPGSGHHHDEQSSVSLTPRERAIIELLAQGHTDETAARELELSRRTVGYALGGLMNRLGVDNRFQLGLALGALRAAAPMSRKPAAGKAADADP